MRLNRIGLCLIFLLAFTSPAIAALFTDDTSTTDKGHFGVEYWVNYYKDTQYDYDNDYKTRVRETKLYLYMLYGLADNWDIGITIPYGYVNYDRDTKTNGFLDIEIESKYRFFEETNLLPSLAVFVDVFTSSGNDEKSLGSGDQDVWLNGILSKTLKENLWVDLNLGYYFTGGKASDDVFIYSFGLTTGFREKLYLYAELYGEVEFERNFNDNVCIGALTAGYVINQYVFVKAGVAAGISDGANDLQLAARLCLSF
ncbi:MAG: transporter [Candidatus Omnitrophota bacterium]